MEPAALPQWTPGTLDIHHIDTGCGNATFIVGPDGTTIMVDCGTVGDSLAAGLDGPCRTGEWVAHYAMQHSGRTSLDYLIATHVHPDHVGDVHTDETAVGDGGGFQLTGLSDVDRCMPAAVVVDRAYPDYGVLPPPSVPFADNYRAWLDARVRDGRPVVKVDVGSDSQIKLLRSAEKGYPAFSIRTLAANGEVWSGHGHESHALFPADLATLPPAAQPGENRCSIAFLLSYGRFRYYAGGDLTCDTYDGRYPWMDVETPVARAAVSGIPGLGTQEHIDVAAANHHGYFDACGPEFVKLLGASAYVIPAWHVTHPGMAQLQRMLGSWPGAPVPSKRSKVFATTMATENCVVNERFIREMCSRTGHVVVRVAPGGGTYRIFVLDREKNYVTAEYGPYLSGGHAK